MKFILVVLSLFIPVMLYAQYDVKAFGAKGDGVALDTRAIQNAIDKAFENKGGMVSVPAGVYKIGTLILKDHINLHLQAGAMLLGSPDYKDYTAVAQKMPSRSKDLYAKYFMIFAEDAKYISITGSGVIHGNGLKNFQEVRPQNLRPYLMRLVNCENIIIRDVQLLESANWTFHLLACKDVNIDGLVIENRARGNRDGLDIDACERVTVSNSRFLTTDDAIVLKATNDMLCQDISISNCVMRTTGSAIKIGTESNGGFKNITVSNCVFKDVPNHAGIELMTVDGGMMQNILIQNIVMDNVNTPIFIRLGNRARPYQAGQYVNKIDEVKDIQINNVSVTNAKSPSSIMGMHSQKIKNVSISNYTVNYVWAQKPGPYNKVPFAEFLYPMSTMFKNLPAYGLYCRNVDGLHLQNVKMYAAEKESRPALVFDRVNDLELFSVKAEIKEKTSPMVYLRNSDRIMASFCTSMGYSKALFEAEDNMGTAVYLSNNVLQGQQVELVKTSAVTDDSTFEDFKTETKYSVTKGTLIKGVNGAALSNKPLAVKLNISHKGGIQLRLLMLNESTIPQKVVVRYLGITQEFYISWKEWGWAPITLLKEFDENQQVNFEITAGDESSGLKIAKAYLLYHDVAITD
ncbi:glycoside hydrolase family 28 protein [Pedobacter heparinus]|uniref:glycoside hydrolase family 28 protein n=1 Tax=Pedobacter heparinus TaxID=984 RepID=UPI002931E908|nr:glycoside hydrolase family 28 protein [Pedobacter heparinus]